MLIVAKHTIHGAMPLCLGASDRDDTNDVWLTACFHEWVPEALQAGWETGTVAPSETPLHNRWEINPCSTTGGSLEHDRTTGEIKVIRGNRSTGAPRCAFKAPEASNFCLGGHRKGPDEPREVRLDRCTAPWSQLVSFGDGVDARSGALYVTLPRYVIAKNATNGDEFDKHICLGVSGRDEHDDDSFIDQDPKASRHDASLLTANPQETRRRKWTEIEIAWTSCVDEAVIIEWVYVPYSANTLRLHRNQTRNLRWAQQMLDVQLTQQCD